ncbi:MAG: glycosyltransferase family 4 protein [Chloroflexi bacterium]|nr:glycosyltransferase family 4 protein [Chloroflexota bacterium]
MHLAINGYFLAQPTTGTGQYTAGLLRELEDRWPGELSVLLPAAAVATLGQHDASRARFHFLSMPLPGHLGKVWFEQVAVPRAAARLGADLLHIPYLGAPLRSTVPVVVTAHDLIQLMVPQLRGGLLVRLYNLLAAASARRATVILADSEHTRQAVIQRLRISPQRVRRAYLAADQRFGSHQQPAEGALLAAKYGLESPYLLYMGGLDVRKNVAALIRAYARSGCQATLAIAGAPRSGHGAAFPDLRHVAQESGVAERVRFLGWVAEEDKPALYRGALLFVFPSRYEGFGLTPLEAMACGTPVLCSNATSLPEVVGDAALLFSPDDEAGLAELIRQGASDPALRERLGAQGLRRAETFSWTATAQQTIEVYHQVLAREHAQVV